MDRRELYALGDERDPKP